MKVLFAGGSKSGKSALAEACALRLSGDMPAYYIATMIPHDDEDISRINAHVARRGERFLTLERGTDIAGLELDADSTVLLDSVTALFTNELFPAERGYAMDENAALRCKDGLLQLARTVKNAVFVVDDLFSDAVRYDETTEAFRRGLGAICCALARECDEVYEVVFGSAVRIK